nr:hypothetical protein [Tanacetum cinerariifolium]
VLELEKTKTSQHNEIASLKRRVKKLERRNKPRIHKLKRLYKVGLNARVESSDDEESLDSEEVFVTKQNEDVVEEVVDAAQVSTVATTVIITTKELTLAQALKALKTLKPKVKGVVIQEPKEPVKPKKKDQIKLDEEAAKWLQAKFDEEEKREELIQESTKKQKVEDDKEIAELKHLIEIIPDEEEVAIDAISLAVKSPRIVDWKIHKEGKKSYYQIVRADNVHDL